MLELSLITQEIPAMDQQAIANVCKIETINLEYPQADIPTLQVLHGGIYVRTIMIPAGTLLTGALVKIATTLIVSGNIVAYIGDKAIELNGYNVLPAAANRKQAFVAKTDTYLTMLFKTDAVTVREAEDQFTDESKNLMSRKNDLFNHIIVTGE